MTINPHATKNKHRKPRMRAWQIDDCTTVAAPTLRAAIAWAHKEYGPDYKPDKEWAYEVPLEKELRLHEFSDDWTTIRAVIARRRKFPCVVMYTP